MQLQNARQARYRLAGGGELRPVGTLAGVIEEGLMRHAGPMVMVSATLLSVLQIPLPMEG